MDHSMSLEVTQLRCSSMTQRENMVKYEQDRIKALQEEHLHIQKKTFTKWMNTFLEKARMEVEDLFVDLVDGRKLLKLLEIISGEKLAKPNNGHSRVHKIDNVYKSLNFLRTKVRLESIGAEDIVDGNPRLILGLIWTIMLRYKIQKMEIDIVDEGNASSEKKFAMDAPLVSCQRKTSGYQDLNITNITDSPKTGLSFNTRYNGPDQLEYRRLLGEPNTCNLNHAFVTADNELDVDVMARPDEMSSSYHTLARIEREMKIDKLGHSIISYTIIIFILIIVVLFFYT